MISKHTPGPWFVNGDVIEAAPDPENSVTYLAELCLMARGWRPDIQAANAALIAAAPELLAAARGARDTLVHVEGNRDVEDAITELEAAIAKAEVLGKAGVLK